MIKTKTEKTPVVRASSDEPRCCAALPSLKASFLMPDRHTTDPLGQPSHWQKQKKGAVNRNGFKVQGSKIQVPGSQEDKLFYVFSSDDVFSCAATSGDVRVSARACSQAQRHDINTKAQSAKTSTEVFFMFLLTTETIIRIYILSP